MKLSTIYKVAGIVLALFVVTPIASFAQEEEDAYKEGTVWNMTIVRTHANATGEYLQGLSKTWASAMEKFQEAGLIESYKILVGNAANDDDFNVLLMIEFKNFAMMDPDPEREKKMDALQKEVRESVGEDWEKLVENYDEIREIIGEKTMRELHLNK